MWTMQSANVAALAAAQDVEAAAFAALLQMCRPGM